MKVEARLPWMSEKMLDRLYGDRLAKLTMGFEVEVAVDSDMMKNAVDVDDDDEPFDEDAARNQFDQGYEPLAFTLWLDNQLGTSAQDAKFVQKYDLVPKFGWANVVVSAEAEAFLEKARSMGLLRGGAGFVDLQTAFDHVFDLSNFEYSTQEFRHTVFVNTAQIVTQDPLVVDLFDLLAAAFPVVHNDLPEYQATFEGLTSGLNMTMAHPPARVVANLARTVVSILLNTDQTERRRALWQQTAFVCTATLADELLKRPKAKSNSILYADAGRTVTKTLFDALSLATEPSDIMETGLWSEADEASMAADFEDAQSEDYQNGLNDHMEEERDAHQHRREARENENQTLGEAGVSYGITAFKIAFPHEPFTGFAGSGADITRIVPDGSITPTGFELVGPTYAPMDSLSWLAEKFSWIEGDPLMTTNDSTGLHCGVGTWKRGAYQASNPSQTIDVLKLLLFLGDPYLLRTFGRERNMYAGSVMDDLRTAVQDEKLARDTPSLNAWIETVNKRLMAMAAKYKSANLLKLRQAGYIEFRIMGGNRYHQRFPEVKKTALRFAQLCVIAADPALYRTEYLSTIYRLIDRYQPSPRRVQYEKAMDPQWLSFLRKNASSLFGSAYRPKTAFDHLSVVNLPDELFNFLDDLTPESAVAPFIERNGKYMFAWFADVLNRSGYAPGLRDKLATYILYKLDKALPPSKQSANDFLDNTAVILWPWLSGIKRIL